MNAWLPSLILSLALGAGCIEASRPDAGDTADSAEPGDTSSTGDVDAPDTATPTDTVTVEEVTPLCREDQCEIGGSCVDDTASRTGAPCQVCDVAEDAHGWTLLPAATSCDDGDPCTPASACTEGGLCVGEQDPVCLEPPSCVTATICAAGVCTYELETDTCLIDGVCRKTGDARAEGSCAVCDPGVQRYDWTLRTSGACDDGSACTLDDTCHEGGICGGIEMACDDQIPCTADYCEGGTCRHPVAEEACYINGACYDDGDLAKGTDGVACGKCEHASDPSDWSPSSGETCDDGDACTTGDTCDAGSCLGILLIVDPEPNNSPDEFELLASGNVDQDASFPSGTVQGNLNPVGDQDYFGYGMLMNLNAIKRKPKAQLRGLDGSGVYELCIWARCGVSDVSAEMPTVNCPVGGPVTLEGSFVGCCTTIAGAEDFGTSLQASCTNDQSSTDVGLVRIRVRSSSSNTAECPGYTLEWGAVDYD